MCQSNITDCNWISHRDGLCLFLTHCTEVEVGNSPEFTSAMVNCGNAQHSEFEVFLSLHTNRAYIYYLPNQGWCDHSFGTGDI